MTPPSVCARRAGLVFGCVLLSVIPASAQLLAAKDGPVVYGHHHLNVTSIDAHKKLWIDTLGGKSVKVGTSPNEIVMFPNVLIFLRQQVPTGGTKGTTVNHIAFAVRDVRQLRDKARAAGYPIVTREEAGAGDVVTDDVSFNKEQGSYSIFVMGPDDIKVQFFEVKNSPTSIALHHIHFAGRATEMRDWYVKEFGATPGKRGAYVTANLPGVDSVIRAGDERDRHPRPRAGPHRLRGEESGGALQETRKRGHQAGSAVHEGSSSEHRDRIHVRPVGYVHRADGRTRQGSVKPVARALYSHKFAHRRPNESNGRVTVFR